MTATFTRLDLEYLLTQIQMAETNTPPVSPHLAFGLREVAGTNNSQVPGQGTFGSADQVFPTATQQYFQTVTIGGQTYTYSTTAPGAPQNFGVNVVDPGPRIISNLISDISAANPAALAAAQDFGAQLGDGYTVFSSNPNGLLHAGKDGVYNTADDNWGIDGIQNTADDTLPPDTANLFIGNVTPDAGLSAPFNNWMTFFGQFFDHGLDLITKGNSGTVMIPLMPDDPLYSSAPGAMNFMALTRATNVTVSAGADGIVGTSDDVHQAMNTTTPFVDQNQTYSSHPSHQVFLREYTIGSDTKLHTTGALLKHHGAGTDGILNTADDTNTGMATWADVKANALKLGIVLTDYNVGNVPLILTDAYGNFIPNAFGGVTVVTASGNIPMNPATPALLPADTKFIDHAFINDMAAAASPFDGQTHVALIGDADGAVGITTIANPFYDPNFAGPATFNLETTATVVVNPLFNNANPVDASNPQYLKVSKVFDNELLDAHYIAGDGRVNENIALTTVHEIFHDEHNRLVEQIKTMVKAELANGDTAFASEWTLAGANLVDGIQDNEWNGERIFQAAKFGTETQYQHLVFEEFARKIAPTIHVFGNVNLALDPAITSEFANAVYRFGHSMLDENVPLVQTNPDGTMMIDPLTGQPKLTDMGLIQAFTNPIAFASLGANGAQQVVQGTTHQIGSEIDEFVTGALRNNLLGLPLDLAALNIARGRDTGVAPLNLVRAQIYDATNDQTLKPYSNWTEFGQFLKHPASLINFIAAYGTHSSIAAATTLDDKRIAAEHLVTVGLLDANAGTDEYNFMHSLGVYANATRSAGADLKLNTADDTWTGANTSHALLNIAPGVDGIIGTVDDVNHAAMWATGSTTGVDNIDLWIGGLAEKQNLFGGLLGSTFNFIFETQLENLQDADRLYYLPRIEGMHWGQQIENNSFAEMIMANTGAKHLPASIFLTPEYTVEAKNYFRTDLTGLNTSIYHIDAQTGFVVDNQGHHVATDPTTWLKNPVTGLPLVEVLPDGTVHFLGDDNFFGNTMVLGGTEGDDRLIAGHADDDTVWGDGGNDWIDGGNGNDFLYGGKGDDHIVDSAGDDIIHGDDGNDFIQGGIGDDILFGGDGNDYIETGASGVLGDTAVGGLGNDVLIGGDFADTLEGNEGDDWLEGGLAGDGLIGDTGAPTGQVPLFGGNDVLDGGAEGDKMVGFSGDDIMLGEGGFDKFNGLLGFDWADFEKETHGVSVDMERREFIPNQLQPAGGAVRDFFVETEGLGGSKFDDFIQGTEDSGAAAGVFNELTNVDLIFNLSTFFHNGVAANFAESRAVGAVKNPLGFNNGNILLGGDGSDVISGRGGNDFIDGDAYLHVELLNRGLPNAEIIREIRFDTTPGDIDTALFRDVMSNYTIDLTPDAEGFITVSHNTNIIVGGLVRNDGVDKIRNVERLQFLDQTISIDTAPNANAVATGTLIITGDTNPAIAGVDPVVGSPLTAVSTLTDADNLGGIITNPTFQWQMQVIAAGGGNSWLDINGATGLTFTPTNAQLAANPLRVVETYTDGKGFVEHVASLPTNNVIANPAPVVNTAPFVKPQVGQIGQPDTTSRLGTPVNIQVPLTNLFGDNETASNLLVYTANIGGVAVPNDGTAFGLTFHLVPDLVNGGFSGATITGTISGALAVAGTALSVKITATDGGPGTPLSVTDTFLINMQTGHAAPVAFDASFNGFEHTNLVADLPGNPSWTTPMAYKIVPNSQNTGTVSVDVGTGHFVFTPAVDFLGDATFKYKVNDGLVDSVEHTVTLHLAAKDDGNASISITGVAAEGGTLSAVIGADDPDGPFDAGSAVYHWSRDGVAIANTTADLVVGAGDVGHHFSVVADYVDGQGFHDTTTGSGNTPDVGQVIVTAGAGFVTASNTLSDPDLGGPFPDSTSYSWEVSTDGGFNWTAVDPLDPNISADTTQYTPPASTGELVRATIIYIDGLGNLNTAMSHSVTFANIVNTGHASLAVSGTPEVGQTLTAVLGADPEGGPVSPTIQWLSNGNPISGANGASLLLTAALLGTQISVAVSYTDGQGFAEAFASTQTAAVHAAPVTTINGTNANNTLLGTAGADIINGLAGNDTITGAAGNDAVNGGTGNDTFFASIGDGNDTYDGGAGVDTYTMINTNAPSSVNLLAGSSSSADTGVDVLISIENVTGSAGNNTIIGDANANRLLGNGGDDLLDGGSAGADVLRGGTGNDTYIVSHTGMTLTELNGQGTDTVLSSITFTLGGNFENLTLTGSANVNGTGNGADNVITGNSGNNTLNGGNGNDVFMAHNADGNDAYVGGAGTDTLNLSAVTGSVNVNLATGAVTGASGTDTVTSIEAVIGGSAGDTLTAGAGVETFTGGAGADIFSFLSAAAAGTGATRTVITDFLHGTDSINLAAIDAVAGGADNAFIFDTVAHTATGQVAAGHIGFFDFVDGVGNHHTILEGNISGLGGAVDFQIDLLGVIPLTATDFTP